MSSLFSRYYQDELAFLRELGLEFAHAYPALAPMLAERSGDPDVERLLEGVAFLTARVRQKLDDELPHAVQGIAQLLFPDFVRPLPPAAILEIIPLPNVLRERTVVPAGTEFASVEVDGARCVFRSTRSCELAPWVLDEARVVPLPGGKHELRLELRVPLGMPVAQVGSRTLRLHFSGDTRTSLGLLAWLHGGVEDVAIVAGDREVRLGPRAAALGGFEHGDALLPEVDTALPGPRAVLEYYALPARFAFVDVSGIERVAEVDPKASRIRLALRLGSAPPADVRVTRDTVRLHCVPILNLFATSAEPIALTPTRGEHLVRPAGLAAAHGEVYAITRVQALENATGARTDITSFYDFAHAGSGSERPFYATYVRPSVVGEGTETVLSFGTARDGGVGIAADTVSIDLLATNRALARALRPGEINVATASSPPFATFRNISAPTPYVPPPFGRDLQWRVVAHAAMGLSSITDVRVLRAALDIYDFHARVDAQASRENELRLAAIQSVRVTPVDHLLRGAPVRGVAIDVEISDTGFTGPGDMFLFGAVLERFFASYVGINSFARTTVTGSPSRVRFAWPARNGGVALL